jgi:hypothetical protein
LTSSGASHTIDYNQFQRVFTAPRRARKKAGKIRDGKTKRARVFSVSVSRPRTTDLTSPPTGDKNLKSDGARAYRERLHPGIFSVDHTGLKKLIRTIPTEL